MTAATVPPPKPNIAGQRTDPAIRIMFGFGMFKKNTNAISASMIMMDITMLAGRLTYSCINVDRNVLFSI